MHRYCCKHRCMIPVFKGEYFHLEKCSLEIKLSNPKQPQAVKKVCDRQGVNVKSKVCWPRNSCDGRLDIRFPWIIVIKIFTPLQPFLTGRRCTQLHAKWLHYLLAIKCGLGVNFLFTYLWCGIIELNCVAANKCKEDNTREICSTDKFDSDLPHVITNIDQHGLYFPYGQQISSLMWVNYCQ